MSPRVLDEWRNEWRLRRGAVAYVEALVAEPDPEDVAWLAAAATGGDADRAAWELRYARRVLGLLVAQRDALDDRTASLVARELTAALHNDRHVAQGMVKLAERQLNERIAVYRDVLSTRNPSEGTGARLGRALLRVSGAPAEVPMALIERAGELAVRSLSDANESLRRAFGAVNLPDDVKPSALQGGGA